MELLQSYFDQIPGYLETTSQSIASMSWVTKVAVVAIPVLIAGFSKHVITILAAVLLSMMAIGALVAPTFVPTIVALGACAGALLVALAGLGHLRRRNAVQTELEALKSSLAELSDAEQRRLLAQVKSPAKAHDND